MTPEQYESLKSAFYKANAISCGRPDMFQFYQNELTHLVAQILLKNYEDEHITTQEEEDDE